MATACGSWVVIRRVISRITIVITHVKGRITPLLAHEPPSTIMEKGAQSHDKDGLLGAQFHNRSTYGPSKSSKQ